MSTSDWISLAGVAATVIAVVLAPIIALWIGGKLKRQSDIDDAKLRIFSTLIAFRHDPLAPEAIRSLNLIDVVFVNDLEVREAWSRYFIVLNDPAFNTAQGFSMREDRRRELLLAMLRSVKWAGKIATVDLLRTYVPMAHVEAGYEAQLQKLVNIAMLRKQASALGIDDPNPNLVPVKAETTFPDGSTPTKGAAQPISFDGAGKTG